MKRRSQLVKTARAAGLRVVETETSTTIANGDTTVVVPRSPQKRCYVLETPERQLTTAQAANHLGIKPRKPGRPSLGVSVCVRMPVGYWRSLSKKDRRARLAALASVTAPQGRAIPLTGKIKISVPRKTLERIDNLASQTGVSRSDFIRLVLCAGATTTELES